MSWESVRAALIWYSPGSWPQSTDPKYAVSPVSGDETSGDQKNIIDALKRLYDHSPIAAQMLDEAVLSGPIRFGTSNPNTPAFWSPATTSTPTYFGVNFESLQKTYWFNDVGALVQADPAVVIAHELAHYTFAASGQPFLDPDFAVEETNAPGFDYDGPVVRRQNEVALDLGASSNVRVSYNASLYDSPLVDSRFIKFTPGLSYTNGSAIDIVRIGDMRGSGSPDNLDTSTRTDDSRDLMFGLGGADLLRGGGGRDFLYGGDDNDQLWGGAGQDFLHGEGGDDLLLSGSGSDFVDGGDGSDRIDLQLEISAGGAAFSLQGVEPPAGDPRPRFQMIDPTGVDTIVGVELVEFTSESDALTLLGDLTLLSDARLTIDLRGAAVAFGQDIVDASGTDKGVHINLGTGSVRALDQDSDVGYWGWVGERIASWFLPDDLRVINGNQAVGTQYSDYLIASAGAQGSGEGYSALYGGGGNDLLVGGGWESHLFGGQGEDQFAIGTNTWIEDAEVHDSVTMYGIPLFGGTKQWWMEGNTAYWAPFSSVMGAFPVIGSSLLTAAAFFIDAVTMKFGQYQIDAEGNLQIQIGWGLGGRAVVRDYQLDLDSGAASGGIVVFEASIGDPAAASLARVENPRRRQQRGDRRRRLPDQRDSDPLARRLHRRHHRRRAPAIARVRRDYGHEVASDDEERHHAA